MRFLALDASTTAAGWCEAEDDEYLASGVYVPKAGEWWQRIEDIADWLDSYYLSEYNQPPAPEVVIYELATGNASKEKINVHTHRLLGAVEYAVRSTVPSWIDFVIVTASQVKASGCHKGAISVAESIAGRVMDPKFPGDEADAIGVWLAGWKKIKAKTW